MMKKNAIYESAYHKWYSIFEKIVETWKIVDSSFVGEKTTYDYAKRGMELMDAVLDNDSPSIQDKMELMECVEQCLRLGMRDMNDHKECEAIIQKHRDKLDELVPCLPINPEKRKDLANRLGTFMDKVSADTTLSEKAKERLYGPSIALIKSIAAGLSSYSERRKFIKACKLPQKMGFPKLNGGKDSSADPRLMEVMADLWHILPEIMENEFYRHIFMDEICLDYIYRQLAKGIELSEAKKDLYERIKKVDQNTLTHIKSIIKQIENTKEEAYEIVDKKKGNLLALYQLETAYRYLNTKSKCMFLFDEPGTRKSVSSAYSMVLKLKSNGYNKAKILIVSPNESAEHWEEELLTRLRSDVITVVDIHNAAKHNEEIIFENKNDYEFHIIGRSVFSRCDLDSLPDYDAVIVDEGHNFKQRDNTPNSKCSKKIVDFLNDRNIEYRYIVTATPVVNDLSEYVNMVSAFTNNEGIVQQSRACPGILEKCIVVHTLTFKFVLRRRKDAILNLSAMYREQETIDVGKKQLQGMGSVNVRSLAEIAAKEAVFKIPHAVETFERFKGSKGLVFSHYIMQNGDDDGILRQFYNACPESRSKIYIAGDAIIDMNGNKTDYSTGRATEVRKQFEESEGDPIAFVSVKTCREGIDEFYGADFCYYAILPYDIATLDQCDGRMYRSGRDITRDCYSIVPIVRYRDEYGSYLYGHDGDRVESFDEACFRLLKSKKDISNACCDGIKLSFNGELLSWRSENDEPFSDVIKEWEYGIDKINKGNKGLRLAAFMRELQMMLQSDDESILTRIDSINEMLEKIYPKTKGFFVEMEHYDVAKSSKALFKETVNKVLHGTGNNIVYVGCGMGKIPRSVKAKHKVSLVDKYCYREGAIVCDRSEISQEFESNSIDMVFASNVMHWGIENRNLSDTMIAFSETLKVGGYCLLTCPKVWTYRFAQNKTYLKSLGMEIAKTGVSGTVKYYLLKKIKKIGKIKNMNQKDLPQKAA